MTTSVATGPVFVNSTSLTSLPVDSSAFSASYLCRGVSGSLVVVPNLSCSLRKQFSVSVMMRWRVGAGYAFA